ncbi:MULTISPECIES: WecB/TagA/CpsF family glycosyltransferase [Rhodomicrobium]|uniref:WecB/TagA/CpsF family glycosyltransferase n=1 Tax=Rhodomicrobium TaxID=1068 RepID=UPI000B4AA4A9|nr:MULTISPECIES: WecB/TagA/CpsF family glycosyltransferase [Rhodomicrobium]
MRRELLGLPIDCLTFQETRDRAIEAMRERRLTQHVAINAAKLVKARHDPELRRDIAGSDIVGIDGMGIVWAARLLGIRVPERVAGVDLMLALLRECADKGYRPYFLGARQPVLDRAVAESKRRWPGLVMAGTRDGYFGPEEERAVVSAIRDSRADCLFIGMPTPQKERFLHRHRDALDVPFIMGVGGGLDVLAGHVRRAPALMQQSGLEWLYRIYQEPGRMWWRYASTNAVFAGLVARAVAARAFSPRAVPSKIRAEG